jgi:formate hydrogenlyase subunit 3/multisubunit Na+/H+ antiporter MnhD subunit
MIVFALSGAGVLLLLGPVAVVIGKRKNANAVLYGVCCAVSLVLLVCAATHLLGRAPVATLALPLGLPWVGSHFRVDALSAFF